MPRWSTSQPLHRVHKCHIVRQFEVFNLIANVEQANLYNVYNDHAYIGTIAEQDGLGRHIMRQFTRLIRPFVIDMRLHDQHTRLSRPFSVLHSKVHVQQPSSMGKVHSEWHIVRRKYDLFEYHDNAYRQFGRIDAPFWSWDFVVRNEYDDAMCYINRQKREALRELFTDQGWYEITFQDPKIKAPLTATQRIVALSCATSIDYDYFSGHSTSMLRNIEIRQERDYPHYVHHEMPSHIK